MDETQKLVVFYCVFSCIYMSVVISIFYVTGHVYNIGKYSFFPTHVMMFIVECVKYVVGNFYIAKCNERCEDKCIVSFHRKNPNRSKFKDGIKCFTIFVVTLIIYFIVIVMLGAPVFSKHEETLMLSMLLCVLTVCPVCLNLGAAPIPGMLFGWKPGTDMLATWLLRCMQLTLFGTWLGAIVIPLDWDRPWQIWPIPCAWGALLGFLVANCSTLFQMLPKLVKKADSNVKSSRKLK